MLIGNNEIRQVFSFTSFVTSATCSKGSVFKETQITILKFSRYENYATALSDKVKRNYTTVEVNYSFEKFGNLKKKNKNLLHES